MDVPDSDPRSRQEPANRPNEARFAFRRAGCKSNNLNLGILLATVREKGPNDVDAREGALHRPAPGSAAYALTLCCHPEPAEPPGVAGWREGQSTAKDPPRFPMPAADEDGGFLIALHRSRPLHHTRGFADSE